MAGAFFIVCTAGRSTGETCYNHCIQQTVGAMGTAAGFARVAAVGRARTQTLAQGNQGGIRGCRQNFFRISRRGLRKRG